MTESAEKPVEKPGTETPKPPMGAVQLEGDDALRIENTNLKVGVAAQAVEHAKLQAELASRNLEEARKAYSRELKNQMVLAQEVSERYGVEAMRYDLDVEKKQLVLRGPRPAPGQ